MSMRGAVLMDIATSPATAVIKILLTGAALFVLDAGRRDIMDISTMVIPEAYQFTVVLLLIPFTILFGLAFAQRDYTEMVNRKKKAGETVPAYSLTYFCGTVLTVAFSCVISFWIVGFVPAYLNVTGLGAIGYAVFAVVVSFFITWFLLMVVHSGIETALKTVRQKAQMIATEVPATVTEVKTAADAVKASTSTITEKKGNDGNFP